MRKGEIVISVWNCRAAVSRYEEAESGLTLVPASNYEELEDQAEQEVYDQGGAVNLSGHYSCSRNLASKATFPKE